MNLDFIYLLGQPTAPPETVRQGGCPKGFYSYKNRCFEFHGFGHGHTSQSMKSWVGAADVCNTTVGAYLATVPSDEYNKFVFSHMYSTSHRAWVGGMASDEREWSWLDNSTYFIYANWKSGENEV